MIKLNKQVESLETILEKIEEKIEELEEKKQAIIDNACDNDREITSAEEKRIDAIDLKIDELNGESDSIYNALDYLKDYTD